MTPPTPANPRCAMVGSVLLLLRHRLADLADGSYVAETAADGRLVWLNRGAATVARVFAGHDTALMLMALANFGPALLEVAERANDFRRAVEEEAVSLAADRHAREVATLRAMEALFAALDRLAPTGTRGLADAHAGRESTTS